MSRVQKWAHGRPVELSLLRKDPEDKIQSQFPCDPLQTIVKYNFMVLGQASQRSTVGDCTGPKGAGLQSGNPVVSSGEDGVSRQVFLVGEEYLPAL